MVTQEAAEKMCNKLVEAYINACKPRDLNDVRNVTLKLISMAGLALAATHGKEDAVALIHSVAEHVGENAHRSHAHIIRTN
ncbi:hypothetical protein [Pseudomonas sp. NMI1173_11]|uniref:hypothetical protein n=1 Tax=Pseudomonas sp. NMI1173_11 TaxID=2903145 RepID=UPI001E6530C8|nr:hypothetical protein [Pseudomonas sp. NMI1173_11]MCE1001856.1 hypothetical protein [Pseudomonas sp. NMI1173_11]